MQYSELKTTVSDLVQRRDLTTTQIDRYVKMTLDRINRKLRADFMETEVQLSVGTASDLTPPGDYLGTVSLYDNPNDSTQRAYVYKSWRDFKEINAGDTGKYYTRKGGKLLVKPALAQSTVVYLTYFAKVAYPTGDTYEPELFKIAPDLVAYGAAAHAAAAYQDDRLPLFNQAFEGLLIEVQEHYASSYASEGPLAIEPASPWEY